MENWRFSASLRFDFGTEEHAVIAARSLSVDDDLKPNESKSTFTAEGTSLVLDVVADSPKHLKKAITTTIPSIELIQETIRELPFE